MIHAVTVLGHDRPGIIADTTARLAGLGVNIEDSSMTRLRGHFAMTLVCAGEVVGEEISSTLTSLADHGSLRVSVVPLPSDEPVVGVGEPYVLTVHGGDRPGIVSSLIGEIAAVDGNITDLTTRLVGDLYLLIAEIDVPGTVDIARLEARIAEVAAELGVGATLRPVEPDEL